MATGGFMTGGSAPWYAQFSAEQLAVVVAEARRLDKPVAAHAHGVEGIRRAVEAGVTTIEHCSFVTETNERHFDERLAAQIAERGIFVCPTVNVNAPYVAELTGRAVGENVMKMRDAGVRIIAGTDAGINNNPHHQYAGGLQALVSLLGFKPAEVIAMATTEAAAALGLGSVTGRLAPGYDADLIVVDGDPGPTSRPSAGCAGSSPAVASTYRTAAGSTSARRAPRTPTRTPGSICAGLADAARQRRG